MFRSLRSPILHQHVGKALRPYKFKAFQLLTLYSFISDLCQLRFHVHDVLLFL